MNMNFKNIDNIENEVINKILVSLCTKDTELYLVGGYIRDLLLEKDCYDRDYVLKGERATEYAKKVADFFNGHYVCLDKDFDIARVVMPDKKNTLDFAGCVNQNIERDLKRRDYTINAIAYRIDGQKSGLIDIVNGISDLENGIVKAISEQNLIDDPLRLIRAFRLAAQLNFKIDNETINYIKKNKSLIKNVSLERVNAELIKLFESKHSASILMLMKETEFLDEILPELTPQRNVPPNLHHHLPLIDHSIESVRQIELNLNDMPEWLQQRLNQEPAANIKLISLLKVATLLHDLGKPSTWQIDELGRHRFIKHEDIGAEMSVDLLKRLKFSKNSIKYITTLIRYHLYPSQLLKSDGELLTATDKKILQHPDLDIAVSEKAMMRMFRKLGDETPEVLMIAMADRLSARGPEITEDIVNTNIKGLYWLIEKYKESKEQVESIPKLLTGNEVMKILGIPRGPAIGKILGALRESQISGDINTKEEAIGFIKGFELNKSKISSNE